MSPKPDAGAPGYWPQETSGVLAPVIESYLQGQPLNFAQVATMRAYLRQWVMAPGWRPTPALAELRAAVDRIRTRKDIDEWLSDALDEGIDPL
jgi:hypothetical protein